ncbi:ATP-binding protein [Piscinibacter sp. XHJ-5]|uniref:ATP-binding protein n=1 Tax=Piscinibacter sp. XHJ-5 TaxID=3037797 RepID=UPI002453507F|nr:ATP-binding protein [Piscinibacter sp. XHJ-5]
MSEGLRFFRTRGGVPLSLPQKRRDFLKRYGLALALAVLAVLVRKWLPVREGTTVYQLPIVAVVLAGWYGGRGPGLVASLTCWIGILYWLIPPADSFVLSSEYQLGFAIFVALCLFIIEFSAARWRVERALEESERRFRLMAETIPEIVWTESVMPRRMLYMSPRYEQVWGHRLGDVERDPEAWMEAVHPEHRNDVRSAWRRWLAGEGNERLDMTFPIVRPDGDTRWIHGRSTLVRDAKGRPYRVSGIAADITDERRAQEALAKAQMELAHVSRLTTLGEFTTSIAHEVSQPLAGMMASAGAGARWLAAEPPDIAAARATLDSIAADGKRARDVIARIRALTKRQVPRKDRVDINHEIEEVLALMARESRSHDIVVRTQLDRSLPRVGGDRVQLQQVLLNLVVNAIEAMSTVQDRPRLLTMASARRGSANAVLVEVRDTGTGLDPAGAERVFDAFYTTKRDGIGIGLSISRSIVEAHGGRLWASRNEPHGAVFQLSLPVAEEGQP